MWVKSYVGNYATNKAYLLFGILAALVLGRGLWLDLMDVDATQYASIALEMAQSGEWLQVQHRQADYLDKPPLLFWTAAAMFRLFGASNWAYRLPSVLLLLYSIYGLYRFCRLFHTSERSLHTALVYSTSIGFLLLCNDIRTDTLLLAATVCAIWQLAAFLEQPRTRYWISAFFWIGIAMLAKGPIGLIVPAFAVGTHVLLHRQWHNLFRWQWVAGLFITAILLVPMCWGLYQQFDLHPEKEINGRTGVSGLYFYFWEQSFGRITGENIWKNEAPPWFFVETYLWAFLPWTLLLPGGLWLALREVFKKNTTAEFYALGGFLLTFIALSTSKYKLPHYIFVTLPWAAVLTAGFLTQISTAKVWPWIQSGLSALVFAAALSIPLYIFQENQAWVWLLLAAGTAGWLWSFFKKMHLVWQGAWLALILGIVLNFNFYPRLLAFQSTAQAPRLARQDGARPDQLVFFRQHGHALDFYNGALTRQFDVPSELSAYARQNSPVWVYTDEEGKNLLDEARITYTTVTRIPHFQSTMLTPAFLTPATRQGSLRTMWLLKI
jgi:4-amino-4-deoxy-L-arabinose transferase-like glycosyltransferase